MCRKDDIQMDMLYEKMAQQNIEISEIVFVTLTKKSGTNPDAGTKLSLATRQHEVANSTT